MPDINVPPATDRRSPTHCVTAAIESTCPVPVVMGTAGSREDAVNLLCRLIATARGIHGERPIETWQDGSDTVARWSDGTHRVYRVVAA